MPILPHIPRVDFYDLMSPFAIEKYDFREMVVDVYGSRNSALLALKNLMEMRDPPKLVRHFLNKELVYAEYVDDFIQHNFTGLKGKAKDFGLEYEKGKYSGRIQTHQFRPDRILGGADRIVEAVGFQPRKFRFVSKTGEEGYVVRESRVHARDGRLLPNIHMTGFVNPQEITDREGETMKAVGVSAFLDHSAAII